MGSAETNNIGQAGGSANTTNSSLVIPYASLGSIVQLSAYVNSADAVNDGFMMLSHWASTGSSGQYQVGASTSFVMMGCWVYTSSANLSIMLGYGTAALGAAYGTTPPTGVVYFGASSTTYGLTTDLTGTWKFYPISAKFPPSSYPFVKNKSGGSTYNILILGTEL